MYDKGKVLLFIAVLVLFVLFPFLYGAAEGNDGKPPELEQPMSESECIEAKPYMRAWHMDLLDHWRDEVVRDASRKYTSATGKTYEKSITNTCMKCHENEQRFCGECHNYAGVDPYCWDCHNDPKKE